ncbi:Imm26 family immunity protein [Agrobacterium vitis]|nr:Imm26 family immunity protein [Agrobacterium vitis]MVA61772.1 hypothetical protein [Agrobacterium vitis]BCH58947.1 hypothetical protein RvVAR0630_15710 [Agrobacterium vitis]
MVRRRKQKRGDLIRIDVDAGIHFYAVALTNPLFAFFDDIIDTDQPPAITEDQPVIFKLAVMDNAVRSGRWPVIGKVNPNTVAALDRTIFFKQDQISGRITAYDPIANIETPISFEEAGHLECAAVWDAEHVEDRLRDHLNGIPNKWWASMRPMK